MERTNACRGKGSTASMWGEIVSPCLAASNAGMDFVEGTPMLDRSGDVKAGVT